MKGRFFYFLLCLLLTACNAPEGEGAEESTEEIPMTSDADTVIAVDTNSSLSEKDSLAVQSDIALAGQEKFSVVVYENTAADQATGFGYDLLNTGKIMIHQPHIPAISGNKGFASKRDAEATGKLMLMKIQKGIMPPTISIEELDSLRIAH